MRQSFKDYDAFLHYDMKFHLSIGNATKNEIISDLMGKIQKISFNTRDALWKTADHIEINMESDWIKHVKLMAFIVNKDGENAARCIALHLDELLNRLKRGVTHGKSHTKSDS